MKTLFLMALLGLTGFVSRPDVMAVPEFREQYDAIELDAGVLEGLDGSSTAVLVVFGDWCGDSVDHVPTFLKIEEHVPFADVQWVAVGRKLADDTGIVEAYGIERVPTFVFLQNGTEIGRIIETPNKSMAQDVADILNGEPAP